MASTVSSGEWAIARMIDGSEKIVQALDSKAFNLGKMGSVKQGLVVGLVWGHAYELLEGGKKLQLAPPEEIGSVTEYVPSAANNQQLVDDNQAQTLTMEEIAALKKEAHSGEDIVKKLISNSATFASKTEFSQAKYIKRKRAKYLKVFTPIRPSTRTLAEHFFAKAPGMIMDLRIDSLAQMLHLANVRAGARVLVVDDCKGLLVGACLERMNGQGVVLAFQHSKETHFEAVQFLNLPEQARSILYPFDWKHKNFDPLPVIADLEPRVGTDQTIAKRLESLRKRAETRQLVEAGGFDVLLSASKFSSGDIVKTFLPLLASSAAFAIYSTTLESVATSAQTLRRESYAINVQLFDTWTREIQVLPGRTHPMMTTSAASGYLLTGTTVLHHQEAVTAYRRQQSLHTILGKPITSLAVPTIVEEPVVDEDKEETPRDENEAEDEDTEETAGPSAKRLKSNTDE